MQEKLEKAVVYGDIWQGTLLAFSSPFICSSILTGDLMHSHLCHVAVLMIDALYQRCTFGMHAEGICSEHIVRINALFQFAEFVILFLGIVILVPHRVQTGPSFWPM